MAATKVNPRKIDPNFVAERQEATGKSSISRKMALRVVASTITTAKQSLLSKLN
jgi:hypothetical protein